MRDKPTYNVTSAVHPQSGEQRFVIVDRDGRLHSEGTAWLQYLSDSGRSPHTAREYGRRVAWYLSWCAQTMDWRKATLSHIALWRQTVAATPAVRTNGQLGTRSASTVRLWIVAVRSFYEWADAHELLGTDCQWPPRRPRSWPGGSPRLVGASGWVSGVHLRSCRA